MDGTAALERKGRRVIKRSLKQLRSSSHQPPSAACRPEMRDPWSIIYGFTKSPGRLRVASQFFLECWEHAVYLEVELPCCYLTTRSTASGRINLEKDGDSPSSGGADSPLRTVPIRYSRLPSPGGAPNPFLGDGSALHLFADRDKALMEFLEEINDLCQTPYGPGELNLHPVFTHFSISNVTGLACGQLSEYFSLHSVTSLRVFRFEKISSLVSVAKGPYALRHLELVELPDLKTLSGTSSIRIETLSLSKLPALTAVEDYFFFQCLCVRKVEFSELPALTVVGSEFLSQCPKLTEVTFRDAPNLTFLGSNWLQGCSSLERLTLASLPNLASIGDGFMGEASSSSSVMLKENVACTPPIHPTLVSKVIGICATLEEEAEN